MPSLDIAKLFETLGDWRLWLLLLIVAFFGMLGGVAHKLTAAADDKTSLPGYTVVGAVASLAVLLVFNPGDGVRLVALSVTAGYGGKAILDAIEGKVRTAIAEAQVLQAKEAAQQAIAAGKKAAEHAENVTKTADALADVLERTGDRRTAEELEGARRATPNEVALLWDRKVRADDLAEIRSEIERAEGAVKAAVMRGR